jgi:4-carboxymuconolactone decarboxylase
MTIRTLGISLALVSLFAGLPTPIVGQEPSSTVVTEADIPSDIQTDSWARLPLPQRENLDAEGQRAYDTVIHPDSRYASGPRGPIAMWLYSPQLAEHYFPGSTHVRFGTQFDQRLTELAILATAREVRSQYEWSAHEPLGLRAGLEQEIIDLVKTRADLTAVDEVTGLGETERTIIQFVREVINNENVSTETFGQAQTLFGARGLMDLVGLIGHYNFVNLTLKTFDVQLAPGRERLLPDLW